MSRKGDDVLTDAMARKHEWDYDDKCEEVKGRVRRRMQRLVDMVRRHDRARAKADQGGGEGADNDTWQRIHIRPTGRSRAAAPGLPRRRAARAGGEVDA